MDDGWDAERILLWYYITLSSSSQVYHCPLHYDGTNDVLCQTCCGDHVTAFTCKCEVVYGFKNQLSGDEMDYTIDDDRKDCLGKIRFLQFHSQIT